MDKGSYEAIPLEVQLKETQNAASGISWAILEAHFTARGFSFLDAFSITTCNAECW
jgi:hypothetical protein